MPPKFVLFADVRPPDLSRLTPCRCRRCRRIRVALQAAGLRLEDEKGGECASRGH